MVHIYVLKLESDRYYVGQSQTEMTLETYNQDLSWTNRFPPLEVIESIPDCDESEVDQHTIRYMKEKKIMNVRGGSFSEMKLTKAQVKLIKSMIRDLDDECIYCSEVGHLEGVCMEKKAREYLIDNPTTQLDTISTIYEKVMMLQSIIETTRRFDYDFIVRLRKEEFLNREIEQLVAELAEIGKKTGKWWKKQYVIKDNQLREMKTTLSEIKGASQMINQTYRKYFGSDRGRSALIKCYQLIELKIHREREINEIYQTYYSDKFLETLLELLYKRRIEELENESDF